jgi:activator of 2-hydroxyglutaryl-CoA dehydratase
MVRVMEQQLGQHVNVPPEALVQLSGAVGAAVLAHQRLAKLSLAA